MRYIYYVLRGGSWGSDVGYVRSMYRDHFEPSLDGVTIGFRLARIYPINRG